MPAPDAAAHIITAPDGSAHTIPAPASNAPAARRLISGRPHIPTSRDLARHEWSYVIRRVRHGVTRHRALDAAASLTFYSALSLFPAALTLVSAVAVSADRETATKDLLASIGEVAQDETVSAIAGPLTQLLGFENPGIALAIGLVLVLWSASGYATAFGRAVNNVYEVREGRKMVGYRGQMLLVTVATSVGFTAITLILLGTPRIALAIGDSQGIGEPFITVWNIGKWPVALGIAIIIVAMLYYFTPNIHRPRLRWVSWGAVFAIVVWAIATLLFGVYVTTVAPYDEVYGWLGGGVVLLLWLYITNYVLVLGAEVDAEITRVRQLRDGIDAEESIRLPLRDSTLNLAMARRHAADVADGRALRQHDVP